MDLVKSPQTSAVVAAAGLDCGQGSVAPPEPETTAGWTREPPTDNCSPGGGMRVAVLPPGGGGSRLSPPVLAGLVLGVPAVPSFFLMF